MRKALQRKVKEMPDLSFFPEPFFLEKGIQNPTKFGQSQKKRIARLVRIADLQLKSFSEVKPTLANTLADEDPGPGIGL